MRVKSNLFDVHWQQKSLAEIQIPKNNYKNSIFSKKIVWAIRNWKFYRFFKKNYYRLCSSEILKWYFQFNWTPEIINEFLWNPRKRYFTVILALDFFNGLTRKKNSIRLFSRPAHGYIYTLIDQIQLSLQKLSRSVASNSASQLYNFQAPTPLRSEFEHYSQFWIMCFQYMIYMIFVR